MEGMKWRELNKTNKYTEWWFVQNINEENDT